MYGVNKMIKIKCIELERVEGQKEAVKVSDWKKANEQLLKWSKSAPREHGYHKVEFTIEWNDNTSYSGNYDLKHNEIEQPDLLEHMQNYVTFHTGHRKPDWITA